MNIIVASTDRITQLVGDRFAEQLKQKPNSVLGMTTGSTPLTLGIYKDWIERVEAGEMDFSKAFFINPDELLGIPNEHPESFKTYMDNHLFQAINISEEQTHIPDSNPGNPATECCRFDRVLKDVGGIDLQLLGLGLNGHVAFIEPAPALPYSTYVVDLDESNRPKRSAFTTGEDVPTQAISIGIGTVLEARAITLVAVGESKANIVKHAFFGPITTKIPASFLQLHKNVTIYLDEAAASKLNENMFERVK